MQRSIQQQQLENLCSSMVKNFNGNEVVPEQIDIEAFANQYLGYSIIYEDFSNKNKLGFTSDGITPVEVIRNGTKKSIVFPAKTIVIAKTYLEKKKEQQKRFLIAHEVGHIIYGLVEGKTAVGYYTDPENGYEGSSLLDIKEAMSILETEANKYGAAILMPDYVVGNLIRKHHNGKRFILYDGIQFSPSDRCCFEKIAKILNVSYSALYYRLKDLGAFFQCEDSSYLKQLNLGGNEDV